MTTANRELLVAAYNGMATAVDRAISTGANIDYIDDDGITALVAATSNNQAAMVEHLLHRGANPNVGLDPPLCLAAAKGLVSIVRSLAQHKATDINVRNHNNFTALHDAAEQGNVLIAELLIERGALVDSLGNGNLTPLHLAAQNGHRAVAALLLENGARVDVVAVQGETPRESAERKGHRDILRLLTEGALRTSRAHESSGATRPTIEYHAPEVLDVEWDDDGIRYVHQQRCGCGRFWTMKDHHRRGGIDLIECQCPECDSKRVFAFKPRKIHTSVTELIRQNRQYIRT